MFKKALSFKIILAVIIFAIIEFFGYIGMHIASASFIIASSSFDSLSYNNYFRTRDMLIGNINPEKFPRYLSVPYLGYIPYPGYKKSGVVQHNRDGYRGKQIPQLKGNKLRILCMGGSTTYGSLVDFPTETYPAQLEAMLTSVYKNDTCLKKKHVGIEVLNAGLVASNSAEELQQYLFKYRYYHPDVVILHTGVNDAFLLHTSRENFQLDYTHARRMNFHIEPLPPLGKWLMKSYFLSFLSISIFYQDFTHNTNGFLFQTPHTYCNWTKMNIDTIITQRDWDNYPFYKNISTLCHEIINDGITLLVLPTPLNLQSEYVKKTKYYQDMVDLNNHLLKQIADSSNATFIPFTYESIEDSAYWVDDCHLNALGERNKAKYTLRFLLDVLHSRCAD
jgi:lysophospholipase L1-like esterase